MDSGVEKAHGRIEQRAIDVLPPKPRDEREWPTVRQICRVRRCGKSKKNGVCSRPQRESSISSPAAAATLAAARCAINRDHWGIEIMHRNRTSFSARRLHQTVVDNAPRNIFSLTASSSKSEIRLVLSNKKPAPSEHFRTTETAQSPVLGLSLNRPGHIATNRYA